MNDYTDFLYHFRPFGEYKGRNGFRTETLYARHMITKTQIAQYPKALEYERRYHRESVMELLTQAIYEGWLPYDVEWWEGDEYSDWEFITGAPLNSKDEYHFYTRIFLAAPGVYPLKVRHPKDNEPSLTTFSPKHLTND